MKKGLVVAVVIVAVVGAGGAAGYKLYQQKAEEQAYEKTIAETIASLPSITVYEQDYLPTVEEEFAGTEDLINIDSIQPDISNVYTTTPGEYEVKYTFSDSKGVTRTASVACTVKPDLQAHVTGMTNIEIDKGEDIPDVELTFDEYVDSVTLDSSLVDNQSVGTYDISYAILGADGDMITADGYTCTVNEIPDLTLHVTGMENVKINQGEDIPTEANVTFDSYVKSVTLNAETVDNQTAGEYDISYSILGTDGNMQTVDGYKCTVVEVENKETEAEENETEGETAPDSTSDAVGNVEVQETVVETGDNTNFIAIISALAISISIIVGVFIYKKKKGLSEV